MKLPTAYRQLVKDCEFLGLKFEDFIVSTASKTRFYTPKMYTSILDQLNLLA